MTEMSVRRVQKVGAVLEPPLRWASVKGLLFHRMIVHLLFGAEFQGAADLLPWYALAMAPMAYNWVFANYHLAVGHFHFLYGMAAAVVVFGLGLTFFHATPFELMGVIAFSGIALFAWNIWMLRESKR